MKLPIFIVMGLMIFFSCDDSKKSSQEELPTFLTYGELPPINYIDEKDDSTITQKYGFKIKRLGCNFTDAMAIKTKRINQKK